MQSTIAFNSDEGATAYEQWFEGVAHSRGPFASMYLLARSADPLVYVQLEIYRSSAAYEQHASTTAGVDALAGFEKRIKEHMDFDKGSIRVCGRVSEPVRLSLASMGAVSHAKTAGHVLLPGLADSDENCVILLSSFRALDEQKTDVYVRAFEGMAPTMKPFASTFFQCKDPSDGVGLSEIMVFRSLKAFEGHYCSRSVVEDLKPLVRQTLDLESLQVIAVSNIVGTKAEEARRALDGLNASYLERVAGYAFVRAPPL